MDNQSKNIVNIGTIGSTGDGKTTLTKAIVKVLSKNDSVDLKECSGVIFNKNNFVEFETKDKHYFHIDCSASNDNKQGLIMSISQMDGAILVVDATVGPMPDTREHILLSLQVGLPHMVVFLNKCDMVDNDEMLNSVEEIIRDLLNEYEFDGDNIPIIRGSALKALEGDIKYEKSIIELMDVVDNYIKPIDRLENIKH